jgi:hypothetical protein
MELSVPDTRREGAMTHSRPTVDPLSPIIRVLCGGSEPCEGLGQQKQGYDTVLLVCPQRPQPLLSLSP